MHGIREINISTGFYGTGTENHGKSDISTGTVWTGTGNQDFLRNCLDGTTGTIFAREREKAPLPVKSRGKFPEEGPGKFRRMTDDPPYYRTIAGPPLLCCCHVVVHVGVGVLAPAGWHPHAIRAACLRCQRTRIRPTEASSFVDTRAHSQPSKALPGI